MKVARLTGSLRKALSMTLRALYSARSVRADSPTMPTVFSNTRKVSRMAAGPWRGAVPLTTRSVVVLTLASLAGLVMLIWPLLVRTNPSESGYAQVQPPFLFLALLPVVIVVVLAEVADGGMDARVLALLGVLTAVNAVLRPNVCFRARRWGASCLSW